MDSKQKITSVIERLRGLASRCLELECDMQTYHDAVELLQNYKNTLPKLVDSLPAFVDVPIRRRKTITPPADTEGENIYVVALQTGGIMEDPEITYRDFQYVCADTPQDAKRKYDKLNNCSFYCGTVLARVLPNGVLEWIK